jgi:hypothetical protein
MTDLTCISLSPQERAILRKALCAYIDSEPRKSREIAALSRKLRGKSYPKITIGVQGGMVQWTSGNPFPIRVCDYDVQDARRCVVSFEPPDDSANTNRYRIV